MNHTSSEVDHPDPTGPSFSITPQTYMIFEFVAQSGFKACTEELHLLSNCYVEILKRGGGGAAQRLFAK